MEIMNVFTSACNVVSGNDELYNQPAKNLWSDYLLKQDDWVKTIPFQVENENNVPTRWGIRFLVSHK